MSKVVVNGEEVEPAKKVKLYEKIKRTEITKLLRKKKEELIKKRSNT